MSHFGPGTSAAQHSLSPISPATGPASSSSAGPTVPPPPASTASGGGGGGSVAGSSAAQQHKRVYQACIPCRRRKVRCDLGSVDDPHDPPCVRCRRESKECYFSATRRKRKNEDDSIDLEPEERDHDDYILRNGRKSLRTTSETPTAVPAFDRRLYSEVPLTPGGSQGRPQPLRRPDDAPKSGGRGDADRNGMAGDDHGGGGEFGSGEANTPLENFEARSVMRREVYGPHDALDLLYKAATDENPHKHTETQHRPDPSGGASQSAPFHARQESAARHPLHPREREPYGTRQAPPRSGIADPAIDPELIKREPEVDPGREEALKAWARFRFVRAGWFTAQEAIDYITYYYDYLSPLTPISPPTFRSHASHLTLLTEEPILAVTLLTIASRYRKLPGTGGTCRAHAIHEQLWTYLRGMIERVVWGQEAFGGGFCGSGAADEAQSSTTAPWRGLRRGSLRTFGTIESLMILTEWHPRALHFPPNEAIDELMLPSYDQRPIDDEATQRQAAGAGGGRRIDSWLEPAWRSDRMCWMLLSTAMGLAYELGVFDDIDALLATGAITRPEYEEESYRLRAYRIKRLLLIYLSQLAGRLGWTNMVPQHLRDSDPVVRKRPHSVEGATPGTNPSSLSNGFNYIPDLELDDQIIHCWAGISNAMHMGNERLFINRKHTTDIIQSGKYITMLKEFQPMLKNWWKEFERFPMPPFIKHILTIEYEYVRIYVNSLSLQAVVERCTNNAGGGGGGGGSVAGGSVSGHSAPQLSPQTQHYYGKLPLGQLGGFGAEDQEYVREVVNGSRNLLRTVVEGLLPGDYLKHVPVRTYFRIISGAMFLLKTFALGAPKSDVEISIGLMDRTVDALRNCVVDDVHLGIRFADMLETLTTRLRNRFIYAPPVPDAMSTSPNHHHPHQQQQADAANGHHANGNGGHLGSDPWLKLKDGAHTLERSSTPANISATPWDMTSGTFPYPSGSASMFGPSTPAAVPPGLHDHGGNEGGGGGGLYDGNAIDWSAPGNEMWYLPPGAALFSNVGDVNVSMTAEGVNVGGMDLLDYMVLDGEGGFGMEGHGFPGV